MDREQCHEICATRFGEWAEVLASNQATPALVLGIGHGSRSGQVSIVVPEDLNREVIRGFLRHALKELS